MARSRYRRYYRRNKARWSANIQRINDAQTLPVTSTFANSYTIAQNPIQTNTSVSQTFTVKNVEVSAYASVTNQNNVRTMEYYIIYVPQGYAISETLPFDHPEWIMAYKYIGQPISNNNSTPTQSLSTPPKIKTRLSRKLQSGDSIIFFYTGYSNAQAENEYIRVNGLIRWWTKAN